MNPADLPIVNDDISSAPLARIDSQDESFVYPLREYLEAHDCRVISGSSTDISVTYHIVEGDIDFVKGIFERVRVMGKKRLAIIRNSSVSARQIHNIDNCKIVLVDGVSLAPNDVAEIFSFFFASGGNVLDKRRTTHVPAPLVPTEEKRYLEKEGQEDEKRIGSIIHDVFGEGNHKRDHKKKQSRFIGQLFFFIIIGMLPVVWYIASLTGSLVFFGVAAKQLKNGQESTAAQFVRFAGYWRTQSALSFSILRVPLETLGRTNTVRGQERLLSFLRDIEAVFEEVQSVIHEGQRASGLVLAPGQARQSDSAAVTFEKLQLSTAALASSLGLAQAQLDSLLEDTSFPFFIPPARAAGARVQESLTQARNSLSYAQSLLTLYPALSGFTEPKTYLVLLQNSSELRPGGGFIGSIGKLTFDQGILSDFTIQDVYVVDGQLKGHVAPPKPIAELLSQEHWYLRDSNWSPDFLVSAQQAAWFYEKETRETVDGVIGLSLPLIQDVLAVTGPVLLSDYNDQITAENFLGKSIFYTKSDFFPGSTAKSDFLGKLARTLLFTLTTDGQSYAPELFDVVVRGISRRDVQFMFMDESLQQLVEHFGWAGRVFNDTGCQGVERSTCLFDPIVVSEANVSVSKVNAFIEHANARDIVIDEDGQIKESLSITYTNTAQNNDPGVGGAYRTYVRFFVPEDAIVDNIMIDGVIVPSRDADVSFPTLPYLEPAEKMMWAQGIGVAFEVGAGTKSTLRISYKRQEQVKEFLDLAQYKQAGLSDVTQVTTVTFPAVWKVEQKSPKGHGMIASSGQLEYNSTIQSDFSYRIRFVK